MIPAQGTTELSSAEDMGPLTSSPLASPSEQQAEEFPIGLEEVAELQPPPKPFIKANMVAHEVRLKVISAHLGKSTGEPELFTEETTSILVFEVGGVIRLSAGIIPGQLLVLTNVDSKREVIAQVKRKRADRPTSCFVELEFAEPAPRFWGMEFSAATALLPKDANDAAAASLVTSAEATTDEPGELPKAPTPAEVLAFRQRVEALRDPLDTTQLSAATEPAPAPWPAPGPEATPAPGPGDVTRTNSKPNNAWSEVLGTAASANSLTFEHPPLPAQFTAEEQELLPKPALNFPTTLPKPRRSRRARGNFTPAFRGGILRLGLLTAALVITATGAAWYKHWIPWELAEKKPSVGVPVNGSNVKSSTTPGTQHPGEAHSESGNTKVASDAPFTSAGKTSPSAPLPNTTSQEAEEVAESPIHQSDSNPSAIRPAARKTTPSTTVAAKHSSVLPKPSAVAYPVSPSTGDSSFVPPKLIKSVRALATMDALRDFERGNVVIDAVVGTSGEVNFVSVLSGPPSLRGPAVDSLKQFQYEPATRNGQPVPAHVNITIHFRFEP